MANLNELVPAVMVITPKVPKATIMQSLRYALRQFCDRSGYWRYSDAVTITAGNTRGYMETPDNAIANGLVSCSEPSAGIERDGHDFYLEIPSPKSSDLVIKYEIACLPERTSVAIDEGILDLYGDQIAEGAAAHLFSTVGVEFENPQRAQQLGARFEQAIVSAKRRVKGGHDSRAKFARPHPGCM